MRLALLLLCALSSTASANKSWNTLKGRLPPGTLAVATIDGKALRSTALFGKVIASYFVRYRELELAHHSIRALCNLDLTTVVTDATVVQTDNFFKWWALGLDGLDQAKALDCAKKALAVAAKTTITAKVDGALTEYTWSEDSRKTARPVFVAWIAKDVLVISNYPGAKESYAGLELPGKPAEGELAAHIAKASAGTPPAWGAMQLKKPDRDGYAGGYIVATYGKSNVTVTGRFVLVSADARGKQLPRLQRDQTRAVERGDKTPELQRIWKAVKLGESGNDITFDAVATEDDFVHLMPMIERAP